MQVDLFEEGLSAALRADFEVCRVPSASSQMV